MTFSPPTLVELGAYWTRQGGVNLGVVGDARHIHGYHLGRDRLQLPDYSVQNDRDRAGLTNAASAIDLGALGGSLINMREFSAWLVERCRANAPGTRDIREIIYAPPATLTVLRYDRNRGHESVPRPGEADDSHLTHTHISFYRDSEDREKVSLFSPYFEEVSMAGDFAVFNEQVESRRTGQPKPSTVFFNDWRLTDRRGTLGANPGRVQIFGGRGESFAIQVTTGQGWEDKIPRPTCVFVPKSSILAIVDAPEPVDPTPYSQADLDAARSTAAAQTNATWEAWVATRPK